MVWFPSKPPVQTLLSVVSVLCPETERPQRFLCDESQQARLDHQSSGLGRTVSRLDDVRLLSSRAAGFHSDLYGDADHNVSRTVGAILI